MNGITSKDYDINIIDLANKHTAAYPYTVEPTRGHNHSLRQALADIVDRRAVRTALVIVLLIGAALLAPVSPVAASETISSPDSDNDAGLMGPGLTAYRLGNYYYVQGDYERAAEYFADAIADTPERLFSLSEFHSVYHWGLFDALVALEQYDDAADTFADYIERAGDKADADFTDYVRDVQDSLVNVILIASASA